MKIGIICASDDELAPFLPEIEGCVITERAMLRIYEGRIHGADAVVLFSGVCKVNAAIAAQTLIDIYGVDTVINAGTAGGMDARLEILDTAISTEVCYHDVAEDILTEFHPWMQSIFFAADERLVELSKRAVGGMKLPGRVFFGRMATGETFITDEGRDRINDELSPLTVDMESASIAHVCYVNRVPFISIRCVTDTASHSGNANFEANCARASETAKDIAIALIDELAK